MSYPLSKGVINSFISTSLFLLLFNPAYSPANATEHTDKKQGMEHEIVMRLVRGEKVDSLANQLAPNSSNSSSNRTKSTAQELEYSLSILRSSLATISSKGKVETEDLSSLSTSLDQFLAYHLLLTSHFETTREQLENNGAGSEFYSRLDNTIDGYVAAVTDVMPLAEPLQRFKMQGDKGLFLQDDAFQQEMLIIVREALKTLQQHSKQSNAPILRASTLPYRRAELASREPTLTPTIEPSYRNTSDSEVPPELADYADTIDAPLSEEILQQAQDLDHDYIRIYEFVRNTIKTEWYAGGMKGAVGTLRQGSGNDVDQASLLIALFRASGLASRYVHGVIELPIENVKNSLGLQNANQATTALSSAGVAFKPIVRGGRVAAVQVEYTWVTAHVPYTNYRGSVVDVSGKTWLPLAPSLKQYEWNPSTGVFNQAGVNAEEEVQTYLSAARGEDLLSRVRKKVTDYLQVNAPDQSYEEQLGSRKIENLDIGLLPTSLPVSVVAVTGETPKLADTYQQRIRFVARQGTSASDPVILDLTVPVAEIASRRVTLSYMPATVSDQQLVSQFGGLDYVPAYLINLRPQLKIDGKQRAVALDGLGAGAQHRFELSVIGPSGTQQIEQTFTAGSYHAIGIVSQHMSAGENSLEAQVDSDSADPSDTEYPAARLLSWRALHYIDKWTQAEEEFAGLLNVAVFRPLPAVTIASNASTVESVLGQPMKLQWSGVTLDAALRIAEPVSTEDDATAAKDWMRLSALQGSSLEHLLFERDFLVNSISADKGIGLANETGIPVYTITGSNVSTALSSLSHPANVVADVENWVRLGMSVEIPRDPISYKAWSGSVWRIDDPQTGAAGYFIAGALAGGSTSDASADWTLQELADLLQAPNTPPPNQDPLAAAEIVKIAATDEQFGEVGTSLSEPFAVMVRDKNGLPVKNAAVSFSVVDGDGRFIDNPDKDAFEGASPSQIVVKTNQVGIAQVKYVLGKDTNDYPIYILRDAADEYPTRAGQNIINASVASYHGNLAIKPFRAIGYPKKPASIIRTNPEPQVLLAGIWVDTMNISVVDEYGNAVSNVPVTFTSGGSVPVVCDGNVTPSYVDAVVFDVTADSTECPIYPVLGDCGSSTRTAKSGVYGVSTGVISGLGVKSFTIQASAKDVDPKKWTYSMGEEACDDTVGILMLSPLLENEEGYIISAAKISDTFKRPIEVTLFVGSEREGWSRANADSASFSVNNGGRHTGTAALGNGGYSTKVVTGPNPGINLVSFTAVNPGGLKKDGTDWVYRRDINVVYGLDPKVTRTLINSPLPEGQDPESIYLNEAGQSIYPVDVHFSVDPTTYVSAYTELDFLKNGVWDNYAIVSKRSGEGSVPLPHVSQYDIEDTHQAQLVLNRGTEAEVKSDKFDLKLHQQIFKNVSPNIKVTQDVDFVNQRSCPIGWKFEFTLTQAAKVTLALTESGSSIEKNFVNGESFAKGDHAIDFHPEDLPPGEYTFELRGISEIDGHEEVIKGVAVSEYTGTSSLPVGHTLVKGVNVKSGTLSHSTEDFSIPGRGIPLKFSRTYSSSAGMIPGFLGIGWSHNYESKLAINRCGEIIISGAGTGMRFVGDGEGGYTPLKGYHGTLKQNEEDGSFDFYSKDGTRYHYKSFGLEPERYLEFIEDTNGNVTSLAYDPATLGDPKLISVQDASMRTLTFTYENKVFGIPGGGLHEPKPVISKVTGPGGIEVSFDYNDFGNLITASREEGSRIEGYGYTSSETWVLDRKLETYTDPNGAVTRYKYNEGYLSAENGEGYVITQPNSIVEQVTGPEGGTTAFEYDLTNYRQTTVTDPRDYPTTYTMNGYGNVLSIVDPVSTTSMEWADDDILMESKTDGRGITTDYTYDEHGNILTETTGGYTRAYTYEKFTSPPIKNRVKTVTDRNGNTTTNAYDGHGNLETVTDPEGGVVEHAYAGNGDRLYTIDANGGLKRFTYDSNGNVDKITDPLGGVTYMSYDVRGQLLTSTDPLSRTTQFSYDPLGNLSEKLDALGGSQQFTYDPVGNKLSETDAQGRSTTWTYDGENRVKTITNAKGDVKSFGYDQAGNKTSETDWQGNTTNYEYDGANRLIVRTEPLGRTTRFSHDEVGNVTTEAEPLNRVTNYGYDALNRKTSITDALSNVTEFTYDGINKISQTDALNRVTTYTYNKNNQLLSQSEPLGRVTRFEYDAKGNRIAETDPNGNRRTTVYDALDRVIEKTDALDNTTNIAYDAVGNVLTEINPRLAPTRHEYDDLNRRLKTIDPAGNATLFSYDKVGNLIGETWANGNQINHTYDDLNRLTATTDTLGAVAAYEYDANGNRTQVTDGRGNTTTNTYDALNRKIQSELPESRTLKYGYDLLGNKTSETDANHNATQYAYDDLNRLTTVTDPSSKTVSYTYDEVGNKLTETDKRNHTTRFDYDDLNRLRTVTDPLGQTVSHTYDVNGNKLSETDKRGTTTTYSYDEENHLLSTAKGGITLVSYEYDEVGNIEFEHDANGNTTAYIYDLRNLLTRESRPLAAITNYTYDAMGDRIEVRDPEARTTSYTYDLRRRKLTETNDSLNETTRYTYDGNGNLLSRGRPLGNTWSYSYDNADRLTTITAPQVGITRYTYDGNGNRLTQTDANNHTTQYEYDALNRQTATIYADDAREEYSYDANGNRTGFTDPKQQAFSYSYDDLNRETTRSYPAPTPASDDYIQGITTSYDANGNVTGVTESYSGATGNRVTTMAYDSFDRLTRVTDAFGKTIKYHYDANGNRTRLTDPDNQVTQYSFDDLNRLIGVINGGGATSYSYDRSGLKTKVSYPNGTESSYGYDRAGRVLSIDNKQGAATVSAYRYTYDKNGNRTQQLETNGGAAETTLYSFDANDRLTQVAYPDKTTGYSYDAVYNRLTEHTVDNTSGNVLADKSYTYNLRNQLTGITDGVDSAQSVTYQFDANGNQTLKSKNGVVTTFVYDVRDQLISVQENTTTLGLFRYDYQGMCVGKEMGGESVRYTYDGKSVLLQSNEQGQTVAKYDYGPNQLLSMQHTVEGRQFYLFDALGSVSNLTNTSGTVQARYQYDAFGNLRDEAGSSYNRFTFTGHERDEETGLYYFKARFYDPDTGRFLTQDSYLGELDNVPSLHRYLYAYANPTVYTDPDGHVGLAYFPPRYFVPPTGPTNGTSSSEDLNSRYRPHGRSDGRSTKRDADAARQRYNRDGTVYGERQTPQPNRLGQQNAATEIRDNLETAREYDAKGMPDSAAHWRDLAKKKAGEFGLTLEAHPNGPTVVGTPNNGPVTGLVTEFPSDPGAGVPPIYDSPSDSGVEIPPTMPGRAPEAARPSSYTTPDQSGLIDGSLIQSTNPRDESGRFVSPNPGLSDSEKLRRKNLYPSGFRESTKREMERRYGDGYGNFIDPETGEVVGADEVTFDHKKSVVNHWASEGYNQTRQQRNDWYNNTDNLEPRSREENSRRGAQETLRYNDTKPGPNFSK